MGSILISPYGYTYTNPETFLWEEQGVEVKDTAALYNVVIFALIVRALIHAIGRRPLLDGRLGCFYLSVTGKPRNFACK
jgi:hypothetical protein